MKELSKKIQEKIKDLDKGKLGVEDLEQLVDEARELYEKLLIIKYKAYEKFGEPADSEEEETVVEEVVEEKVEEVIEEETTPEEPVAEEPAEEESVAFDFTSETEEEQPAFDFSASEPVEEVKEETPVEEEPFPVDEDIKNSAPKEEETKEEEETFPEAANTKAGSSDIFKDSHVEKHEPEDSSSLNQQLGDDGQSLRKKLQNSPIADLKSEISIAKKFEYITFMFEGKNEIYEEAINTLNNCSDGDEAKVKLNEYSSKYNWDLENKSIIKFVELVERRYL